MHLIRMCRYGTGPVLDDPAERVFNKRPAHTSPLSKSGMGEQASIRAFTPGDYGEVVALWRESGLTIKPSDTLQELKKLLALPGTVFLVAETNRNDLPREIVGAVIGAWDGRRAWIYHLAVKPFARRGQIGSKLMRTVEQTLRNQGATKINLLVEPGNRKAAAFYRALGYSDQPLQFFSKVVE